MEIKGFKLANDIFFMKDDSFKNKKSYIIGSVEKNTSLQVNLTQYQVIKFINELTMEKSISDDEIQEAIFNELSYKVNIDELKQYLYDKGIMQESEINENNSEAKMMSVPLFSACINKIPSFLRKLADIYSITKKIDWLLFFICITIITANHTSLISNLQNHLYQFNNSSINGIIVSMLVSIVIIIIHEFAHVLEAVKKKMNWLEFKIILYAGFIPMYYTKYPEMIKLTNKKKVDILFAGLRTNIIITAVCLALMSMNNMPNNALDIYGILILVNFQFIVINISPFTMNDGYYILMHLLGVRGLRLKMWKFIRSMIKGDGTKTTITLKNKILCMFYFLMSITVILINLKITIKWIVRIVGEIVTRL